MELIKNLLNEYLESKILGHVGSFEGQISNDAKYYQALSQNKANDVTISKMLLLRSL